MEEPNDEHPVCTVWKQEAEGAIYHLASILFVVGFMGGSGFFRAPLRLQFAGIGFSLFCYLPGWMSVQLTYFPGIFILFVICL